MCRIPRNGRNRWETVMLLIRWGYMEPGFVKLINGKTDSNVGEQGVERADFRVQTETFKSCSLRFIICNMQIISISQGSSEVKYHIICKDENVSYSSTNYSPYHQNICHMAELTEHTTRQWL